MFVVRNLGWILFGGHPRFLIGRWDIVRTLPEAHQRMIDGRISAASCREIERDLWRAAGDESMAALMQDIIDGVYDGEEG